MTSLDTGTELLVVEIEDGVAEVTINNERKRNALARPILDALPRTLLALHDDSRVRVIVLRGAGDKAFASGADISELGDTGALRQSAEDVIEAFRLIDKPMLAMIHGFCIGAGLLVALQADIRVAADDSQFGVPVARLGLAYPFEGVQRLVALTGPAVAAEMLMSSRLYDAAEALRIGLVNRVVTVAELHEATFGLARMIADNAPLAVAASRTAIAQALLDSGERDVARVVEQIDHCFRSADAREGQVAYAERRVPKFLGR